MNGRAVQLRGGRELVLDGGDPLERLDEFAVVGEVAVVDLDAALGRGDNTALIETMVRRAHCRVGGGIRDLDAARRWLDAGARRIVVGTAASVDFCSQLPRERVIAAVDADRGAVVVEGWQTRTGREPVECIAELAPVVSGFLLTQVEHEGRLGGFDFALVARAVEAAGDARVTAAGGVTTVDDVSRLDALDADAQVGMALYTGRLTLGDAFAASLVKGVEERLWPTVVCEQTGLPLGLVWSTRESVARAIDERRGIYWSRSRGELWFKGDTSGATQDLLHVELDCDRDALRFLVRQHGAGFCHRGTRSCWPVGFDLASLERVLEERARVRPAGSRTTRLLESPELLESKLIEEAGELARAGNADEARHELADLLYFALVAASRHGVSIAEVQRELERRNLALSRRPMLSEAEKAER